MKQFVVFSLFVTALLLAACSEKAEDSYAPVYERMTFDPATAHVGDSVTATVIQSSKGHGLAGTDYVWNISYAYLDKNMVAKDTTVQIRKHTNYDGLDDSDPSVKFLVPENCASTTINVRMNASFDAYIGYVPFMKAEKSGSLRII